MKNNDSIPVDLMVIKCQAGKLSDRELSLLIYADWYGLAHSRGGKAVAVSREAVGDIPGLVYLEDTEFDLKSCEVEKVNGFQKRWDLEGDWWADMVKFG
jgi:hypothetical protein